MFALQPNPPNRSAGTSTNELFVVCCLLFGVFCLLFVVRCVLSVVRDWATREPCVSLHLKVPHPGFPINVCHSAQTPEPIRWNLYKRNIVQLPHLITNHARMKMET